MTAQPAWKLTTAEKLALAWAMYQALGARQVEDILGRVLGIGFLEAVAGKASPTKAQYLAVAGEVISMVGLNRSYLIVKSVLGPKRIKEILLAYIERDGLPVLPDVPADYNTALIDSPDNRLKYPGRQLTWQIPGKGRFWQYDSGYIRNWFAENAIARFQGHCDLYEHFTGDKSMRSAGPHLVMVQTTVHSRITEIRHPDNGKMVPVDARFADTNALTTLPDKVSWRLVYPAGHALTFSHSHSGDAMSVFAEIHDPSGAPRAHFPPNHTIHLGSLTGPRLDIRYLHIGKPPTVWKPK